jgi:DNA polymerase
MSEETTEDYTVESCTECSNLVECRSQIVNGVGPSDADILLVGEAPGKNEDENGEPFVGRSGTVLDEALSNANLDRNDIRITNCVRCKPPDNRDPYVGELENCSKYIIGEIQSVEPNVIVPLGRIPVKQLIEGGVDSLTESAGTIANSKYCGETTEAVISVHPAATLYNRELRPVFEETFELVADLSQR